jgi:steroid delta-isomerase-like uncharacterized protein
MGGSATQYPHHDLTTGGFRGYPGRHTARSTHRMTNTTTSPTDLSRAWADALVAGDPDAVAATFAAGGILTDVGTGQHAEGRDAIRTTARGFIAMFTDLRIETTWEIGDHERFASQWIMSGTHTGDIPGLPATGRTFRIQGAKAGDVRDGAITRATTYWNMADFLTQVGILPTPSAG